MSAPKSKKRIHARLQSALKALLSGKPLAVFYPDTLKSRKIDGQYIQRFHPAKYVPGAIVESERVRTTRWFAVSKPTPKCRVGDPAILGLQFKTEPVVVRQEFKITNDKKLEAVGNVIQPTEKTTVADEDWLLWTWLEPFINGAYVVDEEGYLTLTRPESVEERLEAYF